MSTRAASGRQFWIPALILAAAVLGWLLWNQIQSGRFPFDWGRFSQALTGLDPAWLAASLLLCYLTYPGRALRWGALIAPMRPRPDYWRLTRAQAIGFTAVALFGRPGELVRPYLIAQQESLTFGSQLAVWFLERVFDLLAVLLIFGVALAQLDPAQGSRVGPNLAWVFQKGGQAAASIAVACFGLVIALRFFTGPVLAWLRRALRVLPEALHARLAAILEAFAAGLASTKSASQLALIFAYTFGEWLLIGAAFYCLFRAAPDTAGLRVKDVVAVLGFVAFGSVVQIPGVGGGMQVVTVLVLTELFGVRVEAATAVAIMLWLVSIVSVAPLGLLFSIQEGLNWRKLRRIETPPA
jgi:uncharacterized protein (TIRG00374 family)